MQRNNANYKMYYLAAYLILYCVEYSTQAKVTSKVSSKNVLYDGAQVWRTMLRNIADIKIVRKLVESQDLSIWLLSPEEAVFLVQPERKVKVHRVLSAQGLNHTVVIMDVQRRIEEHGIGPSVWDDNALRRGHRINWRQYPTVEIIDEYLNYLGKQYPSVCKMEIIGHTTEHRTIKMVKVSNSNPSNKGIMVVGGVHAREWIGITSALFILREIVTKFDDQPKFVQNVDWYIIPLMNPDGYHFTYTSDRFWRKNRRNHKNETCYGVDLNRNFGYNFEVKGITNFNPCGESYSGPNSFSEPENVALRNVTLKVRGRLRALVDLHSFGQLILFPWSSKPESTSDLNLHNETSAGMAKAMYEFKRKRYIFGPTYHRIYPATGSLLDWSYSLGIRHSYVIEGRDSGNYGYGFLLPAAYIQEAGQEMLIAVKHLAKTLEEKAALKLRHRWF